MARNYYDQAGRYLVKMDPHPFLCWLLDLPMDALVFRGWLDTRRLPFPGEQDWTCDTVAFVEEVASGQLPWALVLEIQLTPDALLFGRFLSYGGQVWLEIKPSPERGDRFAIGTIVINLTGRGSAARGYTWGQAGLTTILQPREINLSEKDAQVELDRVRKNEAPRVVLATIPLMQGGNDPGIIQQWIELASAEPDERTRGDLGGLAVVFSEAANCSSVWKKSLEGWNMIQSPQVLEWMAEGEIKGRLEALIRVLRRRFGILPSDLETNLRTCSERTRLDQWIDDAATADSLDAFRQATGQ